MKKVLLVLCSPRSKSNSGYLLSIAKQYYKDCDVLNLSKEQLSGCIACDFCQNEEKCFRDDNTSRILKMMVGYDLIVMFCPVYFCGFDSHTKMLIDRSQFLFNNKPAVNGKIALVVVYGAKSEDNYVGMVNGLKYFAESIGKEYVGVLPFPENDEREAVKNKHPEEKLINFLKKLD